MRLSAYTELGVEVLFLKKTVGWAKKRFVLEYNCYLTVRLHGYEIKTFLFCNTT